MNKTLAAPVSLKPVRPARVRFSVALQPGPQNFAIRHGPVAVPELAAMAARAAREAAEQRRREAERLAVLAARYAFD